MIPQVGGVVLAGGLSSRMGRKKAHIHAYGKDTPDMLSRTCALLHELLPQVWVSCRPEELEGGYTCVVDIHPSLGPLSGIHAALVRARAEGLHAVLTLSCDLPFMDIPTLTRLLNAREASLSSGTPEMPLMTTFRQQKTGLIESLVAVYEVNALPLFEAALVAGERKLSRIIPAARRTDIVYTCAEALPFFNLNSPTDLDEFRRLLDVGEASVQHRPVKTPRL